MLRRHGLAKYCFAETSEILQTKAKQGCEWLQYVILKEYGTGSFRNQSIVIFQRQLLHNFFQKALKRMKHSESVFKEW